MRHLLLTIAIVNFLMSGSFAQNKNQQPNKVDSMSRIEKSKKKYEVLFKQVQSVNGTYCSTSVSQ